jgi:hypothetical protein
MSNHVSNYARCAQLKKADKLSLHITPRDILNISKISTIFHSNHR